MNKSNSIIIAIDGSCASGKTTLAAWFSAYYDCDIIHMDDFFLPFELRSTERLAEPGGNIHYERFLQEVVTPISLGKIASYRTFDCHKMTYTGRKVLSDRPVIIVEGAYCMRPEFRTIYDYSIFLTTTPEIQKERIVKRNGTQMLEQFLSTWIPMENHYFETFHIAAACNICFPASFSVSASFPVSFQDDL
ncbi:MAG: uridine kinase [Lachnospiraceae bacterium]